MEQSQKLQIQLSESRTSLAELSRKDELTDDDRAKLGNLQTRHQDLESQYRAALVAEDQAAKSATLDAGESDLWKRAESEANYLRAAQSGQPLAGASKELNQHLGLPLNGPTGGVIIPWGLHTRLQTRADAATVSTGLGAPDMWQTIMQRVWPMRVADRIGVMRQSVGVGEHSWPYINAGPTGVMMAEGVTRSEAKVATLTVRQMEPHTLTTAVLPTLKSLATVPGLEAALVTDLQTALMDKLEQQILTGSGTAPEVTGIFNELSAATIARTLVTAETGAALAGGRIDGYYASTEADVCVLLAPQTARKLTELVTTSQTDNALEVLKRRCKDVMTSHYVPAVDTSTHSSETSQTYLTYANAQNVAGTSRLAIWDGFELIRDQHTSAGAAVRLTGTTLFDFQVEANRREAYELGSLRIN